jgi:DNA mismatch repair protein MSH2
VQVFAASPALRDGLKAEVLRHCGDLDRLNRKLLRGTAGLKDIYGLRTFIDTIPTVQRILKSYAGEHAAFIQAEYVAPLADILEHLANLNTLIESTIDVGAGGEAVINPSFDDDLAALHQQQAELSTAMLKEHTRVMREYGWTDKQLKLELHASYGNVFRVSRKDDQEVRDHPKHFSIQNTGKDGVRFSTAALGALNADARTLRGDYQVRQRKLHKMLNETVASYVPVLDDAKELIAHLDVFAAWASVVAGSRRPMVKPTMLPADTGVLKLADLRHPLVELRLMNYVGNDVALSPEQNAWLITGPNMGGKSTLMRSVGVAVVLAHAGCFVPAAEATISVRDSVACRVGAVDYMSQGLSTFMVEMLESSAILSAATRNSLVIIDELGRGTSTFDGFGLAWAIAQELACKVGAQLLFATHFHEMSDLQLAHGNIQNVHVAAKVLADNALEFLYKVEAGACQRSFGVSVARMVQMPPAVVAAAEAKALELEEFAATAMSTGSTGGAMAMLDEGTRALLLKFAADAAAPAGSGAELRDRMAAVEGVKRFMIA